MNGKLIAIIILLLLFIVFMIQNSETVSIQFLFWSFTTSRAIIIFAMLFLGIAVGWTVALAIKSKEI